MSSDKPPLHVVRANSFDELWDTMRKLEEAERQGLPASTVTKCPCDFCTGKKSFDDNWCAYCADVKLGTGKSWLNMDMCPKCDRMWKDRWRAEQNVKYVGRRVKLARRAKRQVGRHHWMEFRYEKGIVLPLVEYPEGKVWPELDVMWESGYHYLYKLEQLDILPERHMTGLDILEKSTAPRLFKSSAEVDEYVQKERDSWPTS